MEEYINKKAAKAQHQETLFMSNEEKAAFEAGYNKGFKYGEDYGRIGKSELYDTSDTSKEPFPAPQGKFWRLAYAGGPYKDYSYYYWSLDKENR